MLDAVDHAIAEGRNDDARRILATALEQQRETIQSLRDLSFNIEPVALRDQGFEPAVRALAERVGLDREVRVDVDVGAGRGARGAGAGDLLPAHPRRARPGSRACGRAAISITVADDDDGGVALTVADDGRPERRQNGIEELEERARHAERHGRGRARRGGDDDHGRAARVRRPELGSAPKWRTSSSSGSRAATSSASARATRRRSATRSRRTRSRMIVTKVAPSPLPGRRAALRVHPACLGRPGAAAAITSSAGVGAAVLRSRAFFLRCRSSFQRLIGREPRPMAETVSATGPIPSRDAVGMSEFEDLVEEAIGSLPDDLRGFMSNVAVVVEDEPPAGLPLLGPLPRRPADTAGRAPTRACRRTGSRSTRARSSE